MRCFNLTDIETPELKSRGLVNMTLAVRMHLIEPGSSVEVSDDELSRRDAQHYVAVGALAVDSPPPSYILARERAQQALPPTEIPIPALRIRRKS